MRLRAFGPGPESPWRQWGETAGLTAIAVLGGYLIRPEDPLFLTAYFPWLLLAPLLIALRYGVLPGVGSTALLILFWWAGQWWSWFTVSGPPLNYFFGVLIIVLISGQYSGAWRTRLRRVNQINHYLDERLQALTKMQYLVLVSHDRLEQSLITKPVTLREGMAALRALMAGRRAQLGLPAASEFLSMLAQYCQFEVAGLFAWEGPRPATQHVAEIGDLGKLLLEDPMVIQALESRKLTHVAAVPGTSGATSFYVAVAPIVASEGTAVGIVAVRQMPFFALNEETLQMLAVLVGYYADCVVASRRTETIRARFPDCPIEFADEVVRLMRCQREAKIESALVVLIVPPHPVRDELVGHLRRMHRGLDLLWERQAESNHVLVILMPLSGLAAAEVFLYRVEATCVRDFGYNLDTLGIQRHIVSLGAEEPEAQLGELFARGRGM